MAMKLSMAAIRTYDRLKESPKATPRYSDARDVAALEMIHGRLRELIVSYQLGCQIGQRGAMFVFWSEIEPLVQKGAFDDLIGYL
jgi:hypothetical protein